MPVPLAPQRCPECGFSASRAVPGRSRSGASPGLITRSATGAVSALTGSVLCTAAPDPTGLSRLLPSCGDVGRMNLARYSSSQTSHGRPIAAIPASFNAQRYEITEGMLLLLLTFYFFYYTGYSLCSEHSPGCLWNRQCDASSCDAPFPFSSRQPRGSPARGERPGAAPGGD